MRNWRSREQAALPDTLIPAFDKLEVPVLAPTCDAAPEPSFHAEGSALDDGTIAYVLAVREPFELVRDATSQLAGLMVLAAAGARNDAAQAILDRVREEHAQARDMMAAWSGRVPARAAHHHRHLSAATAALGRAVDNAATRIARRDPESIDAIMEPLKAAYRELHYATGALPGFEVVALSQGCCSAHAGPPGTANVA